MDSPNLIQRAQDSLHTWTVGGVFTVVGHPQDATLVDDEICAHLIGILSDVGDLPALEKSFHVGPKITRAPGAPEGTLDLIVLVDLAFRVEQKWESYPGLVAPAARPALFLEADDHNLGLSVFEFVFVLMQLHHMVSSMNSTEMAQEYEHSVTVLPEDFLQFQGVTIDKV